MIYFNQKKKGERLVMISAILFVICSLLFISLDSSSVSAAKISFYDPNVTFLGQWARGTGTTHVEIDDGTRRPTTPNTADYVASRITDNQQSEFGFSAINTTNLFIENITLWVYTGTGSNAQYTLSIRRNGASLCSRLIPANTLSAWFNCTLFNPTGNYSNLTIHLSPASRSGGGAATDASVYAAYLEVFENEPPNVTMLNNPPNNTLTNASIIDFNFTAQDDINTTLSNCTLWTNFTGTWAPNNTAYNVQNNTISNITIGVPEGNFIWNVMCYDFRGLFDSYNFNYSLRIDRTSPFIYLIYPENNTQNNSNNNINFGFNVSDSNTLINCTLIIDGQPIYTIDNPLTNNDYDVSSYLENGNYTWGVQCIDSAFNLGFSGYNNLNVSVYLPIINSVNINDLIILNAGATKKIECNITASHGSGGSYIDFVNASFHYFNTNPYGALDNNSVYFNDSCINTGISGIFTNYSCSFNVYYYANNGTWHCNVTATDLYYYFDNNRNSTYIEPLYAINVSSNLLDYGDVPAGSISFEEQLGVVNFGNMPVSLNLLGYGGQDPIAGDGLSMVCPLTNIPIENHRYGFSSDAFLLKNDLTSNSQFSGLTLNKQTNPALQIINQTYWQIDVPGMEVALCNGTVRFIAGAP